jgi:hypothetical protein
MAYRVFLLLLNPRDRDNPVLVSDEFSSDDVRSVLETYGISGDSLDLAIRDLDRWYRTSFIAPNGLFVFAKRTRTLTIDLKAREPLGGVIRVRDPRSESVPITFARRARRVRLDTTVPDEVLGVWCNAFTDEHARIFEHKMVSIRGGSDAKIWNNYVTSFVETLGHELAHALGYCTGPVPESKFGVISTIYGLLSLSITGFDSGRYFFTTGGYANHFSEMSVPGILDFWFDEYRNIANIRRPVYFVIPRFVRLIPPLRYASQELVDFMFSDAPHSHDTVVANKYRDYLNEAIIYILANIREFSRALSELSLGIMSHKAFEYAVLYGGASIISSVKISYNKDDTIDAEIKPEVIGGAIDSSILHHVAAAYLQYLDVDPVDDPIMSTLFGVLSGEPHKKAIRRYLSKSDRTLPSCVDRFLDTFISMLSAVEDGMRESKVPVPYAIVNINRVHRVCQEAEEFLQSVYMRGPKDDGLGLEDIPYIVGTLVGSQVGADPTDENFFDEVRFWVIDPDSLIMPRAIARRSKKGDDTIYRSLFSRDFWRDVGSVKKESLRKYLSEHIGFKFSVEGADRGFAVFPWAVKMEGISARLRLFPLTWFI